MDACAIAQNIGSDKIQIAYECFGDPDKPPVLLIMGVGGQMIAWHEGLIEQLVNKGLYVTRFDNRDVGLSTHLNDAPMSDLPAALSGDLISVSYTFSDMAADTVGLIDSLDLKKVHVVGASMGGFIAQTIAIEYSQRVRSLTSIMSTTGDMSVGQPCPDSMEIFKLSPPTNRDDAMDNSVAALQIVGSPGFPVDEEETRIRAGLAYDRSYDSIGILRQAAASVASGDRTAKLRAIHLPTLVIHGADDKMCNVSGGEAAANAISDAKFELIDGMGNNLPRELWPKLVSLIAEHIDNAEAAE